jgi:RNA polymerase sigma factor (TIGR02999 family)
MELLSQQHSEISEFLRSFDGEDRSAWEQLVSLVYDELKARAHAHLYRERQEHTLNTTALVHEAYLRLADQQLTTLRNSRHFFWVASEMMRRILVDHARSKRSEKRGGGVEVVPLEADLQIAVDRSEVDVIGLDEALIRLAALDAQQAKIVELRYFAGCSIEETAGTLGISVATVKRDWAVAKAWLRIELRTT